MMDWTRVKVGPADHSHHAIYRPISDTVFGLGFGMSVLAAAIPDEMLEGVYVQPAQTGAGSGMVRVATDLPPEIVPVNDTVDSLVRMLQGLEARNLPLDRVFQSRPLELDLSRVEVPRAMAAQLVPENLTHMLILNKVYRS